MKIGKNKVIQIVLDVYSKRSDKNNYYDIISFNQMIYSKFNNENKKKIKNIVNIIKGFPLFLFKKLYKLKSNTTVVHLCSGFLPVFFGVLICKFLKIPCVIGPNVVPLKNLLFKKRSKFNNLIYYIRDLILKQLPYNKMICFSKYHRYIIKTVYKVNKNKMEIIGIGINRNNFKRIKDIKSKFNLFNNDNKIILYVGRPTDEKGFKLFINTSKKLLLDGYKINILIAGIKDSEIKKEIETYFGTWSENVRIIGWVPRSKLIKFYNLADLYINPSIDETWSMTTVEALSCGVPCICSNIPIFRYHIQEYTNGLLFKVNSINDLINKITEGLKFKWKNDEISDNAINKYDWNKFSKNLLNIYKKIIRIRGEN
ncbi:MAG: glycosyltransferase family 4 protein [Candidatus Helarchaeota archaeon]